MKRSYRKWTQGEKDQAALLSRQGCSLAEIGRSVGRSPSSVGQQLAQMNGLFHSMGKTCRDCSTKLRDTNRCGRCKRCSMRHQNADPAFQARRIEALKDCDALKAGSPIRHAAAVKAAYTRLANPEYRAWLAEQVRNNVAPLSRTPEALAKRDRKAQGRKVSEHYMGWCPAEYRDLYREIKRKNALNAEEARTMIFDMMRIDRERAQREAAAKREALSPFERQQRALERGAQIIANDTGPQFGQVVDYGESKWELGRVG